jgi:prepilin-type N-terminal cleavage/methylation domain-containing protein
MLLYNAHRKSNKGFTLVEMIVTVIIVGVIATIAAPNFLGLLNQNRVKDGLSQVEGAIKEAQRQAIRQGKICKIRFTSDADGNSIIQVRPNETIGLRTYDYSGCLLSNRQLPDSVSFSLLNAGTLELVNSSNTADLGFSPKGNPDIRRIMVISHPGISNSSRKCVEIAGLLGNMITGNYDESATLKCKAS